MSFLEPGPQSSLAGRTRRILNWLSVQTSRLDTTLKRVDLAVVALTLISLAVWIRPALCPEALRRIVEVVPDEVHKFGILLMILYLMLRFAFRLARSVVPRAEKSALEVQESEVDMQIPCTNDVRLVSPAKAGAAAGGDLEIAVRLCHDALGFEHDGFSLQQRYDLYERWCRANGKAMLLITPQFGAAKGSPIGVTIVLPLTREGLQFIQQARGGVLHLEPHYIYPDTRRTIPFLLIDTLILQDRWIPVYGHLALKALFHHVSLFYNPKSWNTMELYCSIYQGGVIGKYLTGMRRLIERRGFQAFGKTTEGETLFRLCINSMRADPLTRSRYQTFTAMVQKCRSAGSQ